ncbi:hypothetical protein OHA84_36720 [Streptomyces sp. NBC_00513]|uniref:hypothetical protein n=1 Tax=unclassified Streptomyces TaxID=2593676 RepID=UPI0022506595|nr:hypothetical protein [Streptomyces sp. NBC_00424]MCX5070955.1 hypothetical protein [Streptomyces sp. NBC_00424]WUD45607.1 hypothetical protein OHA84_36720 [Streptomyces sp. NBC_00513]
MVSVGRSRVWVCVGQSRIRADRIAGVTTGHGELLLYVIGVRGTLALSLADGVNPAGPAGTGNDWADELLRAIEEAADQSTGSLIAFEAANSLHHAGFTARTLTDNGPLIRPPTHQLPDTLMPQRPVPDSWATPRAQAGDTG